MDYSKRTIIGLTEEIRIKGSKTKTITAKIDTGATKSSVDIRLAEELNLGPVVASKLVKSAHGNKLRPVIHAEIELAGQKIDSEFTLADRGHMKYMVLIGQNTLNSRFLVDPLK